MNLKEKYNTELKGCLFTVFNTSDDTKYKFGKILDNGDISITWVIDNIVYSNRNSYTILNAYELIRKGVWIIDINDIRKKKLKKLMNGFSRKI